MAKQQTQAQKETDQMKYERIMGNHAEELSYLQFIMIPGNVAVRNELYDDLKLTGVNKAHLEVIWSEGQRKQAQQLALENSLPIHCASDWKKNDLNCLKIVFDKVIDISEFLPYTNTLSERATQLTDELSFITTDFVESYERTAFTRKRPCDNEFTVDTENKLQNIFSKCLFMIQKYKSVEATVNKLVDRLFQALGFDEKWLYIFPEFTTYLHYGNDNRAAKADFALMDIVSFYRAVVVEDKNFAVADTDNDSSEAQVIAEAIGLHQANTLKQKTEETNKRQRPDQMDILGIRVSGFKFYFYLIPYSPTIMTAFETVQKPSDTTKVKQLVRGMTEEEFYFDFRRPEQRATIIVLLDRLQQELDQIGFDSERRNSKAGKIT